MSKELLVEMFSNIEFLGTFYEYQNLTCAIAIVLNAHEAFVPKGFVLTCRIDCAYWRKGKIANLVAYLFFTRHTRY